MSLEHSPGRQAERAAFSLNEFCASYRVSRSQVYKLWSQGIGPRFMRAGTKIIITAESAADWAREREAATQEESVRGQGQFKGDAKDMVLIRTLSKAEGPEQPSAEPHCPARPAG